MRGGRHPDVDKLHLDVDKPDNPPRVDKLHPGAKLPAGEDSVLPDADNLPPYVGAPRPCVDPPDVSSPPLCVAALHPGVNSLPLCVNGLPPGVWNLPGVLYPPPCVNRHPPDAGKLPGEVNRLLLYAELLPPDVTLCANNLPLCVGTLLPSVDNPPLDV